MSRFLSPRNVWKLIRADLPKLDEVGGEFAGAKANVKFVAQGEALNTLEERVATLELIVERLGRADTEALVQLERLKEGDADGR